MTRSTTALQGSDFADEVRGDEARAAALGISGVPFFVIDEAYGISGAQPAEVLLGALERAWSESHPATTPTSMTAAAAVAEGPACADGDLPGLSRWRPLRTPASRRRGWPTRWPPGDPG